MASTGEVDFSSFRLSDLGLHQAVYGAGSAYSGLDRRKVARRGTLVTSALFVHAATIFHEKLA
jgi:hypothetical protein